MIISRKKLNKYITIAIIETARKCGRNLSIKQQKEIEEKIKGVK